MQQVTLIKAQDIVDYIIANTKMRHYLLSEWAKEEKVKEIIKIILQFMEEYFPSPTHSGTIHKFYCDLAHNKSYTVPDTYLMIVYAIKSLTLEDKMVLIEF